jgi:hypothetical protein
MSEAVSLIEALGAHHDARYWSAGSEGLVFAPKTHRWTVVVSQTRMANA